jgi:hypothetical protein
MFAVQYASVAYHGRDGVLEDQLLLAIVLQENRVLVEGPNFSGQLNAADKVNGDGGFVFPNRIQERILNILCRLVFHNADLLLSSWGLDGV